MIRAAQALLCAHQTVTLPGQIGGRVGVADFLFFKVFNPLARCSVSGFGGPS